MNTATKFVAACCRWPHTQASKNAVATTANAITDWDEVRQIVARHRVIPLVHQAIKDLGSPPQDFLDWAKQRSQACALHSMQLTHDALKIDRVLKDACLHPLHFKGPVLGQIAYGSVALKVSKDLDIFVNLTEVPTAIRTLEKMGYHGRKQNGPISSLKAAALVRNFKHLGFRGPKGTIVELHWRFANGKGPLAGLENNVQRHATKVASVGTVETFSPEQMVIYLSLHGALHHWVRLKWLADLVAFLEQLPVEERDKIIAKVLHGPASDAFAQALSLSDTLFETRYSPPMTPRAKALYRYAMSRIDQPYIPPKRFWGDIGFLNDVLATRHLYPSIWATIWGMKSNLVCEDDVLAWPLPRHLNGIYPIIRLPSFLIRRLRHKNT